MVMTTFWVPGYLTWRADTAKSVFGQFTGHNSGVHGVFGWLQNLAEILCPPMFSQSLIKTS